MKVSVIYLDGTVTAYQSRTKYLNDLVYVHDSSANPLLILYPRTKLKDYHPTRFERKLTTSLMRQLLARNPHFARWASWPTGTTRMLPGERSVSIINISLNLSDIIVQTTTTRYVSYASSKRWLKMVGGSVACPFQRV